MDTELASEHVLWRGSPVRHPAFDRVDVFLVPFSIVWLGFFVFWEKTAVRNGEPAFFLIWGIPFLCFGLYLNIGRFAARQIRLRSSVYTITDQRLIVRWNGWGQPREHSIYLKHLEPPQVTETDDGVGTIRFGSGNLFDYSGANRSPRRGWNGDPFTIYAIRDVDTVLDLLVENR